MEDKEVGELWKQSIFVKTLPNNGRAFVEWVDASRDLIRKLVEKRKHWHEVNCLSDDCTFQHKYGTGYDHTNDALRDFGIDPATWDGTKSKP